MTLLDWLEERTGYRALVRATLDEEIPGGARARYVFGSVLVFLVANQAITGVLLAAGYAPSVHDAWASVAYTQDVAPLGWLVRGLHASGASAAFLVVVLHLMQVVWAGAYRRPREVTWWVGLGLLGLLFTFGLTGYLLPWDQRGYFATQVATNIAGATPVVGPMVQRALQGGTRYGNLTLTRFYALHVLVLPGIVVAMIVAHVALFRRHGVTPPADVTRTDRFYPKQLGLDTLAVVVCLAAMLVVVIREHGAPLSAPADPGSAYEARPEWYFLPLFELLRHLPGSLELVGALGAPLLAGAVLFALPLLDPSRRVARELVSAIVAVAVLLGVFAVVEDRGDEAYHRGRARAEAEARAARLAFRARTSTAALSESQTLELGDALFDARCASCHVLAGRGEARAPDLDGWASREWIDAFFAAPDAPRFFGRTPIHGMKAVELAGEERLDLVEWVYAQGGAAGTDAARVKRGEQLFDGGSCADCHERDGTSEGHGVPNLGGHASAAWLEVLLTNPAAHFGKKNAMPRFDTLEPAERSALVARLRTERLR